MKHIRLTLVAVGLVALLAGCGKDDDREKLTCNDIGKVKDAKVLETLKNKCGLGGKFPIAQKRKHGERCDALVYSCIMRIHNQGRESSSWAGDISKGTGATTPFRFPLG